MRVLLMTDDRGLARRLRTTANGSGCTLCVTGTAAESAERMFRDAFDALLLTDAQFLRSAWRRRPLNWPQRIYLYGQPNGDDPVDGLTFCFSPDADPAAVLTRVCALGSGRVRQTDRETLISGFLQRIGVPVSLVGFACLCAGIRLLAGLKRSTDLGAVGDLYEVAAEELGMDAPGVEHAMRHAIDAAWTRADPNVLYETFGNTVQSERAAPSNAAFLFRAAEQIRATEKGV